MIQQTFTSPTRYIRCPSCQQRDFAVSQLQVGCSTAWYCHGCGVHFALKVIDELNADCNVLAGKRVVETLVTLRSTEPVTLVVSGCRFLPDEGDADFLERQEFFYNESDCPTNYVRAAVAVRDDQGDEDPHGIFRYVKTEPVKTEKS